MNQKPAQIEGAKRTGFAIGDRVGVFAGSTSPQYRGTVVGYGRDRRNKDVVIKPDHGRCRETWSAGSLKLIS